MANQKGNQRHLARRRGGAGGPAGTAEAEGRHCVVHRPVRLGQEHRGGGGGESAARSGASDVSSGWRQHPPRHQPHLGFSAEDRTENVRRIGEIAKLFTDVGVIVLTSFISPYRADRDMVRELHESAGMAFLEIHIDVPLAEAEKRDPKGLYKKAREGKIKQFTGIDAPYEAPEHPELVLHTDHLSVAAEAAQVIELLKSRGIL